MKKEKPNKIKTFMALSAAVLAVILISSCSYHFSGTTGTPFGVERISVSVFENHTSEIGVESIFSNDLIYELTSDGRMQITKPGKAEAFFSGTIKSTDINTITRERSHVALERRVSILVNVKMKDPEGNILWSGENIGARETYLVSPDKQTTEQNRKEAISKLSKKIAQYVYQRLSWE